jgi:hypothetical protein
MPPPAWYADLPVTDVDPVAGTWTASTDDVMVIVDAADTLARGLSVTWTMADGVPIPVQVGDVVHVATRLAQ